jgi:hypothetical protein
MSTSVQEPVLLMAEALSPADRGSLGWNADHNGHLLTISNEGRTIEWRPRTPELASSEYPLAWVPASTLAYLHSGRFEWSFVVEELAGAQLGVGFLLLWNVGPDWGFYGYLGSSTTAWAYDPSTGDVVSGTESIEGGLPRLAPGQVGAVFVRLDLPRQGRGTAWFSLNGVQSLPIALPKGAVVLPAACFFHEFQRVSLSELKAG